MKTNSIIALILSISLFGLFGCADKYEVDYEAPVKIEFAGVDQNNRVSLTKGIAEYTATIKVQGEIMSFEIYQADSKTGMQGSLIEETAQSFADGTDDKLPSMARAFQNAGYSTGHIGKWHMGGGRDVHNAPSIKNYGFDEYISTYESPDPEPAITATKWIWSDKDSVKRWRRTEYFVDKSIEFVKKHKGEPFFLNLWPDDMHTPWVPEFKQKERKSWETQEAFAPVLAEMDKQLGRFIKTLDELGVGENTIIIFTSDNGPAPSFKSVRSAYLRGTKNSLYEGGIRMPFIVRYPKKIKAGQVNNESVLCAVDLYPTLCSIAGIKTEKGYKGDGQNYSKVLLGKSEAKRKTDLMWDFGRNKHFGFPGNPYDRSPHLAIRSGKWKLLVNGDGSDAQLYDMEKDKFEKNNIANEHPDLVAKLSKKVCKWYEENKDKGKE